MTDRFSKRKVKESKSSSKSSEKAISIRVGEHLFSRVDTHVRTIRFLDKNSPKKKGWIATAIQERLEQEKGIKSPQDILKGVPCTKHFNFILEPELNEALENHVNILKKVRNGFSKKQWVLEAIIAKLEQEEMNFKKLLDKELSNSP